MTNSIPKASKEYDLFSETYNTDRTQTLIEQLGILKSEINVLRAQNSAIITENRKLEKTLDNFKNIPGIVGIVSEIIDKNKVIVKGYNGVVFYIQATNKYVGKFKVGDRLALAQNNLAIIDVLNEDRDARATALELIERPTISYSQVGGLKDVIRELEETVSLPLKKPEKFKEFGIKSPKGVLLYGPPGTGKTMLAKAVANESKCTFISLSGSELIHKFIGEGAKIVKDLFAVAREKKPSIIFIDEIDSVAAYRMDGTNGADREVHRTMMQLLVEMDGFKNNDNIKIIGATNRIDILDEAILRPGRFDRVIKIPLPDEDARREIVKIHIKNMPLDKSVTSKKLAELLELTSGADIEAICREAGIFAIRENNKSVKFGHFREAYAKVVKKSDEKIENNMFR